MTVAIKKVFKFTRENDKTFDEVLELLQSLNMDYVCFHKDEYNDGGSAVDSMIEYYGEEFTDDEKFECCGNWGLTLFFKTGEIITIHSESGKPYKHKGGNV